MKELTFWRVQQLLLLPTMCSCSWTAWSAFSACSRTCGGGNSVRRRSCFQLLEPTCPGVGVENRLCNMQPCRAGDTDWLPWSVCSRSCGGGLRRRRRTAAAGPTTRVLNQQAACNLQNCQISGKWNSWAVWSSCVLNCPSPLGIRRRRRACLGGTAGRDGCLGAAKQSSPCPLDSAPVCANGPGGGSVFGLGLGGAPSRFDDWNAWSPCSFPCGLGGVEVRRRVCAAGSLLNPLTSCAGAELQTRPCNRGPCSAATALLAGGGRLGQKFSDWSSWLRCSRTCGSGQQSRTRACRTPPCKNLNDLRQTRACNVVPCRLAAVWAQWTSWTACSRTCGTEGVRSRRRSCTGKGCPSVPPLTASLGSTLGDQRLACNRVVCSRADVSPALGDLFGVGKWQPWSVWSACSQTCGVGSRRKRRRSCFPPQANCIGPSQGSQVCPTVPCPIPIGLVATVLSDVLSQLTHV